MAPGIRWKVREKRLPQCNHFFNHFFGSNGYDTRDIHFYSNRSSADWIESLDDILHFTFHQIGVSVSGAQPGIVTAHLYHCGSSWMRDLVER